MLMLQRGRGASPPNSPPWEPQREGGKGGKTHHHEVELAVHGADSLEDERDPGHLFILRVRRHCLGRPAGWKLKVGARGQLVLTEGPRGQQRVRPGTGGHPEPAGKSRDEVQLCHCSCVTLT